MHLVITRQKSVPTGTPASLLVTDTGFTCNTLELQWNDNDPGISCIKADIYAAQIGYSGHLGRDVLRFENKNGRTDIEAHNANFAGQVSMGMVSQVLGCIAVGSSYGDIERPDGKGTQYGILNSVDTLDALLANIGTGCHTVEIKWAEGCNPELVPS